MYCAHCGEWNSAGSRTCIHCGQPLAAAPGKDTPGGRKCPMCGTVNTPAADFCTACGARVVLMSGIDEAGLDILRPAEEPAVPLSAAAQIALNMERQRQVLAGGDDGLPDPTLQRLAGDPPEQRSRSLFGGSTPAAGNLSWLDSLRDDSPPAVAEPKLDMRVDPAPLMAAGEAVTPDEGGIPDWLAQLRGTKATPAADTEVSTDSTSDTEVVSTSTAAPNASPLVAADALPAWLRFTASPEAVVLPSDPAASFPPEGGAPAPPMPSEPSALPSWTDSTPPPADGLPAWMSDNSAPTPAPPIPAVSQAADAPAPLTLSAPNGLPSWMDSTPTADGLPAWMSGSAAASVPSPGPAVAPTGEPNGLPSWMDNTPAADGRPTEPAVSATAPAPSEPSGLPSWMEGAAPATASATEGLWLDSSPTTPPVASVLTRAVAADDSPGLPSWMDSTPTADGLPSWMAGSPAAPATPPPAPADDNSLPTWMDNTPPTAPATANSQPPTSTADMAGLGDIALPAWLQAAGAGAPPAPAAPTAHKPLTGKLLPLDEDDETTPAPAAADGVVPAWMSEPTPAPGAPNPATADAGLPAWMSGPAPVAAAPAISPPDAGLPVWMSGPSAASATAATPAADAELPAWMSNPLPVPTTPAAALPPPDAGLPTWMSGPPPIVTAADELSATPNPPAADPTTPPVDGFPSWMSGPPSDTHTLPADDLAGGSSPPAASQSDGGFLSESDLPAWLRAVQAHASATPVPEAPPAPQPVESGADELPAWLRALGGSDDEIDQVAVTRPSSSTAAGMVRVIRARPPRAGAVQVFEQLLAAPTEPTADKAPARNAMLAAITVERIFALVLLAVVGLFVGFPPLSADTVNAPVTTAGPAFYNTLKAVPPAKPVLLVYDWDAGRYGEMYPLSRAVTAAVVGTNHHFVTISTVPEGTGFALGVTAGAIAATDRGINCSVPLGSGAYGTRYLHLGYRPGSEAGLAELANSSIRDVQHYDVVCYHDVSNTPILAGTNSLSDFGAVVLLAGDERALRMWIEQVGSRLAGAQPTVPLLAALPEAGRPAALPYTGGNGALLRSAVYGVAGAEEIESLSSGGNAATNPVLGRRMHTESAALLTLAGALLLAFISGTYRWINRRSGP